MGIMVSNAAIGIASVNGARIEEGFGSGIYATTTRPPMDLPKASGPPTFCTRYGSGLISGPNCPNTTERCCLNNLMIPGLMCCGFE